MKNKWIAVYETLCPNDPILNDDPRRENIIQEMKLIEKAKTNKESYDVVGWWSWDSQQQMVSWITRARKIFASLRAEKGTP